MFFIIFFCMSAATQGSKEGCVEPETRVASDSTVETEKVSDKSVDVTPRSSGDVTDDDLLGHSER